jgi:hypothetical protein
MQLSYAIVVFGGLWLIRQFADHANQAAGLPATGGRGLIALSGLLALRGSTYAVPLFAWASA